MIGRDRWGAVALAAIVAAGSTWASQEDGAQPPRLTVGAPVESALTLEMSGILTPTLERLAGGQYCRREQWVLEVDESRPYRITHTSYDFDAYLTVGLSADAIAIEDDDSGPGTHARFLVELEAGRTYYVNACAIGGEIGRYSLEVVPGEAAEGDLAREAAADARRAVEASAVHEDPLFRAQLLIALGQGYLVEGSTAAATTAFEAVLAVLEGGEGEAVAWRRGVALQSLAELARRRGDFDERVELVRRAVDEVDRGYGEETSSAAALRSELAGALVDAGRPAEAEEVARDAYRRIEALGDDDPDVLRERAAIASQVGRVAQERGDLSTAAEWFERSAQIMGRIHGPDHPDVLSSRVNLALVLAERGSVDSAIGVLREVLEVREASPGTDASELSQTLDTLGGLLAQLGRYREALPLLERAVALAVDRLGEDSIEVARLRGNLGVTLQSLGLEVEARRELERSLSTYERTHDANHPSLAGARLRLAESLDALASTDEARRQIERALVAYRATYGDVHPDCARAHRALAKVLSAAGDLDGALEQAELAAAAGGPTSLGDVRTELENLRTLGALHRSAGDQVRAVEVLRPAVDRAEETLGLDHVLTCRVRLELALSLSGLERSVEADAILTDLVERVEALRGADYGGLAVYLDTLAIQRARLGRPDEALALFERAVLLGERDLGADHPESLLRRVRLAEFDLRRGRAGEARRAAEDAVAGLERALGPLHPTLRGPLATLAYLDGTLGDHELARRRYERTVAIVERAAEPDSIAVARALVPLAAAQGRLGELEQALDTLDRAESILVRRGDDEAHPTRFWIRRTRAGIHDRLGDRDRAIELYREILADRRVRAAVDGTDGVADALSELGGSLLAADRLEEARAAFDEAVALLGDGGLGTATVRYRLAERAAMVQLLLGEAREAWRSAVDVTEGVFQRSVAQLALLAPDERRELSEALRTRADVGIVAALLTDDPAFTGRVYAEVVSHQGRLARAEARAAAGELGELRGALLRVQSELSALAYGGEAADGDARAVRLAELRAERESLERDVLRALEPRSGAAVTVDGLRAALPSGGALVDFFVAHYVAGTGPDPDERCGPWGGHRVVAFVVRPDREHAALVDLGPSPPIRAAVETHLARVGAEGATRGLERLERASGGGDVVELLWRPLSAHLEGVETVLVSPDRFLATLPFETLEVEPGVRALERWRFAYLHDAATLAAGGESPPPLDSLLAVGGVDFDAGRSPEDPRRADWAALSGTKAEVDAVASRYAAGRPQARTTRLTGAEATAERLAAELERHAVCHVATHGYFHRGELAGAVLESDRGVGSDAGLDEFLSEHPGARAGLVCAGANSLTVPDALLTADEVAWLDLSGAALVVLSACETGLGVEQAGEGLAGLRRSLHVAGARRVVSSLWSVPDAETAELMASFYRHLLEDDLEPAAALRAAQLERLARHRAEHGEDRPGAWGAFVLSR